MNFKTNQYTFTPTYYIFAAGVKWDIDIDADVKLYDYKKDQLIYEKDLKSRVIKEDSRLAGIGTATMDEMEIKVLQTVIKNIMSQFDTESPILPITDTTASSETKVDAK
jgi:hypothetical protein